MLTARKSPGRFQRQGLSGGEVVKSGHGRPRGFTRMTRALGLDRNPLRRATDRAEAWIRVGLLAVFLVAGPMAAIGAGHWAHRAGITAVLAAVMTLAAMAVALLAARRLALAFLTRRRLAAWETAWSRVGPQWSRRRP
jgi:hypothetical protein